VHALNKQEKNLMCKDIFFKNQELNQKWVRNGLGIKMSMHIISFWVLIIFQEYVHRWRKHSLPSPMK